MSNDKKPMNPQEKRDKMIADRGTKSLQAAVESGIIRRWTAFHCAQDFPAELQDQIVAAVSKMEKAVKQVKAPKTIKAPTFKVEPITSPAVEASKAVAAASVKKATKAEKAAVGQAGKSVAAQLAAKKAEKVAADKDPLGNLVAASGPAEAPLTTAGIESLVKEEAITRDEAGKVDMNIKPSKKAVKPSPVVKAGIPLDAPFKSVTEQGFKLVKSPNSIA